MNAEIAHQVAVTILGRAEMPDAITHADARAWGQYVRDMAALLRKQELALDDIVREAQKEAEEAEARVRHVAGRPALRVVK